MDTTNILDLDVHVKINELTLGVRQFRQNERLSYTEEFVSHVLLDMLAVMERMNKRKV